MQAAVTAFTSRRWVTDAPGWREDTCIGMIGCHIAYAKPTPACWIVPSG